MSFAQIYRTILKTDLLSEVLQLKREGWRLIQISATFKAGYDLIYSFERDYNMINLRFLLPEGEWVDSVSSVYSYAYLYENEIKDLFGVEVSGMNVDFQGHLYQTAVQAPFRGKPADEEAER